jgi:hypothetical protein
MAKAFDRDQLLAALDEIGQAAIEAGTRLDIAVFGGSALLLASNFRFSTEDLDMAEIGHSWPDWLTSAVKRIADRNGWSEAWLNDAVTFHLSPLAHPTRDLVAYGTFPRIPDEVGLTICVPSAKYMLALKLKALRVSDFPKGTQDMADVANLLRVLHIVDVEQAIAVLREYFPRSAADAGKQRFMLKRLLASEAPSDAPQYPRRGI